MKQVLLLTPTQEGKLDVFYTASLAETIRVGIANNIEFIPQFIAYDALVQRVRNDLLKIAYQSGLDTIWIDDDMGWDPMWLVKMVNRPEDIIAAPVRKKTDEAEIYNVLTQPQINITDDLLLVESVGFGLIKLSKEAIKQLWASGEPYVENGVDKSWAFDVRIENGVLVSEDIIACRAIGLPIYVDITMNPTHTGTKTWRGSFCKGGFGNAV